MGGGAARRPAPSSGRSASPSRRAGRASSSPGSWRGAGGGSGYATEGARAALAHAFTSLNKDRVISLIHAENRASIRVAERIGETSAGPHRLRPGREAVLRHRPGAVRGPGQRSFSGGPHRQCPTAPEGGAPEKLKKRLRTELTVCAPCSEPNRPAQPLGTARTFYAPRSRSIHGVHSLRAALSGCVPRGAAAHDREPVFGARTTERCSQRRCDPGYVWWRPATSYLIPQRRMRGPTARHSAGSRRVPAGRGAVAPDFGRSPGRPRRCRIEPLDDPAARNGSKTSRRRPDHPKLGGRAEPAVFRHGTARGGAARRAARRRSNGATWCSSGGLAHGAQRLRTA